MIISRAKAKRVNDLDRSDGANQGTKNVKRRVALFLTSDGPPFKMSYGYGDGHYRGGGFPYSERQNNSTISKMQHQYWVTKETVFRKLGKKEDSNIVASDAELDAKLELFKSIQESCLDLQRIIDKYQERICLLAQEENAMGRFLKDAGRHDKTGANSVMLTLGRTLSQAGQQRISLRSPLLRLFQEVETFRHRAIEDTNRTVLAMERARTEYRASLSWMKDVSQELDPDTYKQMEKFRKVQETVKQSKAVFDRYKLDCLQKVDLLAAARCNMFSHALILYHNVMNQFATSTSEALNSIADTCKETKKFEFNVVKELSDLKPEEDPASAETPAEADGQKSPENDEKLLEFDLSENDGQTDAAGPGAKLTDQLAELNLDLLIEPAQDSAPGPQGEPAESKGFLPSQLLMQGDPMGMFGQSSADASAGQSDEKNLQGSPAPQNANKSKSSWLDLFSELDPLANPDTIGQQSTTEPQRNC
ncbi:Islet cell autoantigen [Nesidiocoris tenuis]|uniref:Islet cell autoantigen n=1 Tax=Nesidiocoris tenuis TaxID=355587 RepID=A0ABN7BF38_9HEMI|nr:Islet cell autoantigen [Nesidiocoris tenuis]